MQTIGQVIDLQTPPEAEGAHDAQLGDAIVQLLRVMERTAAQLRSRRQDDLDKAAFLLLVQLVHDGPLRSRALAEATLADPSTVSRHVALLVDRGLVERRADPDDGRATLLAATDEGVRLAGELRGRRNAIIDSVVAGWPAQDRQLLQALLVRFTRDLERTRPALLAQCTAQPAHTAHTAQTDSPLALAGGAHAAPAPVPGDAR